MSGGRLTLGERHRIALGIAEGLAYAEIARGLGRPTSTVSREVLRNGGSTAYRADVAHRATERRARRRGRLPHRGVREQSPQGRDAEAVREYEELFAAALMRSGLPVMPARALAGLHTTDGGLTAAELVRRLGAGPAPVSRAVAFLEGQGLVRRERGARGRRRYVVDDDVLHRSMTAAARAAADLAATARQGAGVLGPRTPAAARLENIARCADFVAGTLTCAAALHSGQPPADTVRTDGGAP
ncbi:helix-turn-helix domain-containing protein [Streptomyces sp. NPDC057939]|uniref:helix-turn-helix domain-containing protein n=1 Tax=Streptomyces sp. NPDC057939 TaxID=3346284 RepID=UPI0036F01F14